MLDMFGHSVENKKNNQEWEMCIRDDGFRIEHWFVSFLLLIAMQIQRNFSHSGHRSMATGNFYSQVAFRWVFRPLHFELRWVIDFIIRQCSGDCLKTSILWVRSVDLIEVPAWTHRTSKWSGRSDIFRWVECSAHPSDAYFCLLGFEEFLVEGWEMQVFQL